MVYGGQKGREEGVRGLGRVDTTGRGAERPREGDRMGKGDERSMEDR